MLVLWSAAPGAAGSADSAVRTLREFRFQPLREAVADLWRTFGDKYGIGPEMLKRLDELEALRTQTLEAWSSGGAREVDLVRLAAELERTRERALLANPLLDFDSLLVVKRAWKLPAIRPPKGPRFGISPLWSQYGERLALPFNHTSLASVRPDGWDNEIAILSPVRRDGKLRTLYRPPSGEYVGEIELHWDADRLLFTSSPQGRYRVFEIRTDGTGLRQITPDDQPDVDNFDACYLPDGRIVFASNASYQAIPCWNGLQTVACLYSIRPDGTGMRQLTFDQDENSHPSVLNTGQVIYHRWEYTNTPHVFAHLLFQMNPDGTGQRLFYGTNSYWPNALYYPRAIPGEMSKIAVIVSGYHGDRRMGELFVIDPSKGRSGRSGVVAKITGEGRKLETPIRDFLTSGSWPKFTTPWPLSEKYFIVSMKPSPQRPMGIYLVDVFGNTLLLHEVEGYALLDPVPLRKSVRPPVLPDRVDLKQKEGTVYIHDVYAGPGLRGLPRGEVKKLRIHAYHFGYRGLSGWDKIGIDGPWDVMRILGTVPVEEDGSAMFRVPANIPIAVQPLDADGAALQVMRSWFTVMPGEFKSCVGCHESQNMAPPVKATIAATREPARIEEFYGPARGFDFERDIQRPVLDRYCVSCHNGEDALPDLRGEEHFPEYKGILAAVPGWWGEVDHGTYRPELLRHRRRKNVYVKFTPAYEALHPYVRRYGLEGDYVLSNVAEYHASTSELVQMLAKGHHGVRLDREAWERIYTWIDLNVPCHGTWSDVLEVPFRGRQRRVELAKLYGGAAQDFDEVPALPAAKVEPVAPEPEEPRGEPPVVPGWPFDVLEAFERQKAAGEQLGKQIQREVDLGDGRKLTLMLIPAGEFVMGSAVGAPDERPLHRVRIEKPFWMAATEITNAEYALFDPDHDSRYLNVLHINTEERGFPLNRPEQPVVRVSWEQAMAFCGWLSEKTGLRFTLPTEEQWEWAARAGTATPFYYGFLRTVFSPFANLADASLKGIVEEAIHRETNHGAWGPPKPGRDVLRAGQPDWILRVDGVNDKQMLTAPPGRYLANAWGLYDMHGNVAEWTRSEYVSYSDGKPIGRPGRMVVRGGSFMDRPHRATSGFRWAYPKWQPVYNVGIRVVAEVD